MTPFARLCITATLALTATLASAAPFCLVTGAGKQCFYYNAPACQRAAASLGGACVVNSEEKPSGNAPFCAVSGAGAQCNYYNFQACENAARAVGGTCAAR